MLVRSPSLRCNGSRDHLQIVSAIATGDNDDDNTSDADDADDDDDDNIHMMIRRIPETSIGDIVMFVRCPSFQCNGSRGSLQIVSVLTEMGQ